MLHSRAFGIYKIFECDKFHENPPLESGGVIIREMSLCYERAAFGIKFFRDESAY